MRTILEFEGEQHEMKPIPTETKKRILPHKYNKGDKVKDIYTGEIFTVKLSYWQHYAGGSTSDYTVEFEATETQPTPWNKSTNLIAVD